MIGFGFGGVLFLSSPLEETSSIFFLFPLSLLVESKEWDYLSAMKICKRRKLIYFLIHGMIEVTLFC